MTHAPGHLADTMTASMIAAVVEEAMVVVDETIALAVITMTEIEDTEEDVIATMTALASTATPEDVTTDTATDVVVVEVEATLTATIEAETVEEIVMVVAPARLHLQLNMVIQLLVQRLGNLMVAATLMTEPMVVENFDC